VDAQTPAAGLSYNLRVGTSPGGADVVSPEAGTNGSRRVTALGNAGSRLAAELSNVLPGTNYYWSVQAVDSAFAGGPFAQEGSFALPVPNAPHLLSIQRETNRFRIEASGSPGWNYGILSSPAPTTNAAGWPRLGTAAADAAGHLTFTDTNSTAPLRFYRGVYP